MRVKIKYALFGVAFGAFFPIGAFIFEILLHDQTFSFASIRWIHNQNPLLYIIDSAPLWLGIFALFGGTQQAKSNRLLNQFEEVSEILSKSSVKLNIDSKDTFSEMKKELDQLTHGANKLKVINESINGNINYCKTNSSTMADSSGKMIISINNLFSFNDKANKGNKDITSNFLNFLTRIDDIEAYFEQVKSIGKQINILALNSGIEASKIGEKGKGFSVIAQNIKGLAEKTFEMSSSIDDLLKICKTDIEIIKAKIDNEQENLASLIKTSKALEDEMKIFQNSVEIIFSVIEDTHNKNDKQNQIFGALKLTIENIETAYKEMYSSLSKTIEEETTIVEQINNLKQNKNE